MAYSGKKRIRRELAQELQKPVIKKFKRMRAYGIFKDNFWAVDLIDMESLSSLNRDIKYLWCVIDSFFKYAWVKPLKDKNDKTFRHGFIK